METFYEYVKVKDPDLFKFLTLRPRTKEKFEKFNTTLDASELNRAYNEIEAILQEFQDTVMPKIIKRFSDLHDEYSVKL